MLDQKEGSRNHLRGMTMKLITLSFLFLLSACGFLNGSDAHKKCTLLNEKLSFVTAEELKIAARGIEAFIELCNLEQERAKDQGLLGSLYLSGKIGNQLLPFVNSHLASKTSLSRALDDIYDLELECCACYDKESDELRADLEQRKFRAEECLECLKYLIAKREIAEYERA